MRVLICEYFSASPLRPGERSLAAEGLAMLRAAASDLAAEPDVEVVAAVNPRLADAMRASNLASLIIHGPPEKAVARHVTAFDGVLLVAPEIDGIAAAWARSLESAGAHLLSPPSWFVAWATDKLAVTSTLTDISPPTISIDAEPAPQDWGDMLIVKPRDGVGALFTAATIRPALAETIAALRADGFRGELIVQPRIDGLTCSAAVVARGEAPPILLPPADQTMEERSSGTRHRLQYLGGAVPVRELSARVQPLLHKVVAAVAPFRGWFGVDMIVGGPRDVVLDVNPRLTTSYLGYSRLFPGICARLLLGRETADDLAALANDRGMRFRFDTDGSVTAVGH